MLEDLTPGLKPLWSRDLRSQSTTGNHSLGSFTQEGGPPSSMPGAGTDLPPQKLAIYLRGCLHFPNRAFISVCFCLPLSLPLSIFLSFPITPVRHSSIRSCIQFWLCLCDPFSPPLALGNFSSVFCHYSFGFFRNVI